MQNIETYCVAFEVLFLSGFYYVENFDKMERVLLPRPQKSTFYG